MSAAAPRLLLLSNGHGEDLSGAMLARALLAHGVLLEALPLVGHGHAYRRAGVSVVGPTREYSTGGLGYTSLMGWLRDLIEGQPLYVLRRLLQLWHRRGRYDLVVAVGDLVPVLAAWACRLPSVVYLVAYSSHYEGRLRLPWPCGWLLRRPGFRRIWSRDALTATDLSQQLDRPVQFLGNPFLDPVHPHGGDLSPPVRPWPTATPAPRQGQDQGPWPASPSQAPLLALLPGSRLPEALTNLRLMLQALGMLPPPWSEAGALRLQAALVRDLERSGVLAMAEPLGWRDVGQRRSAGRQDGPEAGVSEPLVLMRQGLRLELHWGRFSQILTDCDLVLAMAGTASEQAVGLGKAVIQLAGPGPQFTAGFAEAQRRLLGPGVVCAPGGWGSQASLAGTAQLLAGLLSRGLDASAAPAWRRQLAAIAAERIGAPGGSTRMADAILAELAASAPAAGLSQRRERPGP